MEYEQPTVNRGFESLSYLIAGVDKDVQSIFLRLPPSKLRRVFVKYGELYGIRRVIEAKNAYPDWQAGTSAMSGLVVARLLNLVPLVIHPDDVFKLVKKIRKAYFRRQYFAVDCLATDWFRKLLPVVDMLVDYSSQFELPAEVIEKLHWLTTDSALAAHELVVAAEIAAANVRTAYLKKEYAYITRMLSSGAGMSEFKHKIELPQGTIDVTISRAPFSLVDRIPLIPVRPGKRKRVLLVNCKNPQCNAELDTSLRVYDGEPIVCAPTELTCIFCGATHVYNEFDTKRSLGNLNAEVQRGLFGDGKVIYNCPFCGVRLHNPLSEAGKSDSCPTCQSEIVVPKG